MDEILLDFVRNEVGWRVVEQTLDRLLKDQTVKAARADTYDKHLIEKGRMEGVEKVLVIFTEMRNEIKKEARK